jgi:signal peptidase I
VLLLVGIAIAAALLVRAEGIRPLRIISGSMVPAVEVGDWVIVRDLDPGEVHRGDIVLFRFPLGTDGRAIKRVAARSGDPVASAGIAGGTVPAGHVFLLGDNAEVSIDSRNFGPVPETELVGRVVLVIPGSVGTWGRWLTVGLMVGGLSLLAASHRRRPARRSPTPTIPEARTSPK